jgi:hypothetical protein
MPVTTVAALPVPPAIESGATPLVLSMDGHEAVRLLATTATGTSIWPIHSRDLNWPSLPAAVTAHCRAHGASWIEPSSQAEAGHGSESVLQRRAIRPRRANPGYGPTQWVQKAVSPTIAPHTRCFRLSLRAPERLGASFETD